MNRVCFLLLALLLTFLSISFSSCAVFEAIGDSLSQFYDNSVSYFNAYYNAEKIFEEAEATVIANQRDAEAKAILSQKPVVPSPPPRDKFNTVIDKCSSILSFYPQSSLVDDAILLIGKSYYHLQEYLKAERKFSELLSQYPNSPLALEGQLWFAKTLEQLRKDVEAKQVAAEVTQKAVENDDEWIAAEVLELQGRLAERDNDTEQAIAYYDQSLKYASDAYSIARTKAKVGDLYVSLEQYEKANPVYISIYEDGDPEVSFDYYGRIRAIRGYAALKLYDTAIYLAEEMLDDYRFSVYHPTVRLEYAGILLAAGYTDDAVNEYQFMDTTFVKTENGANAAFELAEYYERQKQDYRRAAVYYGRAGTVQNAVISPVAKRRESSLQKIIVLRSELIRQDSLMALSDSARAYPERFLREVTEDTSSQALDTTTVTKDSISSPPRAPKYIASFVPLNADSMQAAQAKIAYDLGEIYYTELELPDSALVWFQKAWDGKIDSVRAPRTLFILAELKQKLDKAAVGEVADIYQMILDKYPRSNYAHEVLRLRGVESIQRTPDLNDYEYAVAESLLWAGDYPTAIAQLQEIIEENPASPIGAKSRYALGWIYEYRLSMPDSALMQYRVLAEQYSNSQYAQAVKNKIPGAAEEDAGKDEAPKNPQTPQEPGRTARGKQPLPEREILERSRGEGAARDTVRAPIKDK